jgi:hypothetical protein
MNHRIGPPCLLALALMTMPGCWAITEHAYGRLRQPDRSQPVCELIACRVVVGRDGRIVASLITRLGDGTFFLVDTSEYDRPALERRPALRPLASWEWRVVLGGRHVKRPELPGGTLPCVVRTDPAQTISPPRGCPGRREGADSNDWPVYHANGRGLLEARHGPLEAGIARNAVLINFSGGFDARMTIWLPPRGGRLEGQSVIDDTLGPPWFFVHGSPWPSTLGTIGFVFLVPFTVIADIITAPFQAFFKAGFMALGG